MNLNKQFLNFLKTEDFDAAESLIASDIFDVEDQMEELTEEDYQVLEPHWSAVNTGEDISTPFFVLKKIYDYMAFKEGSTIIDLGSGHGKPSLVFGALNPSLNIIGYDIVLEKVNGAKESAKKLSLDNLKFFHEDLSTFKLPEADYYYSFNPVNIDVADKIAKQILEVSKSKKVSIICSDEGMDSLAYKAVGFTVVKSITDWGIEVLA